MTSDRKIKANRVNAQASTGPKTTRGRARVGRNALRHALTPFHQFHSSSFQRGGRTRARVAGTDPQLEIQELARRIAEVQMYLHRVRHERHRLLSEALIDPEYQTLPTMREKLRAIIHHARVFGPDTPMPDDVVEPEGPHKLATLLPDKARQLLALDRYERRALSRRKFAIRAFDAAGRRFRQ